MAPTAPQVLEEQDAEAAGGGRDQDRVVRHRARSGRAARVRSGRCRSRPPRRRHRGRAAARGGGRRPRPRRWRSRPAQPDRGGPRPCGAASPGSPPPRRPRLPPPHGRGSSAAPARAPSRSRSAADAHVEQVHAARRDADANLSRPGLRVGVLLQSQDLWAAERVMGDCSHGTSEQRQVHLRSSLAWRPGPRAARRRCRRCGRARRRCARPRRHRRRRRARRRCRCRPGPRSAGAEGVTKASMMPLMKSTTTSPRATVPAVRPSRAIDWPRVRSPGAIHDQKSRRPTPPATNTAVSSSSPCGLISPQKWPPWSCRIMIEPMIARLATFWKSR